MILGSSLPWIVRLSPHGVCSSVSGQEANPCWRGDYGSSANQTLEWLSSDRNISACGPLMIMGFVQMNIMLGWSKWLSLAWWSSDGCVEDIVNTEKGEKKWRFNDCVIIWKVVLYPNKQTYRVPHHHHIMPNRWTLIKVSRKTQTDWHSRVLDRLALLHPRQ